METLHPLDNIVAGLLLALLRLSRARVTWVLIPFPLPLPLPLALYVSTFPSTLHPSSQTSVNFIEFAA